MMNYSVFLTKIIVGVFPTVQIVDNSTLKFPQDAIFFLPILVANILFKFIISPLNPVLVVSYVDDMFGYSEKKQIPLW